MRATGRELSDKAQGRERAQPMDGWMDGWDVGCAKKRAKYTYIPRVRAVFLKRRRRRHVRKQRRERERKRERKRKRRRGKNKSSAVWLRVRQAKPRAHHGMDAVRCGSAF